uniref:NADH dehydrogenase subunit 6 n=1 Tax=Amritodus flavoscutatus TaxID=2479863 RepID=UPI002E7A6146|nr:NADH dehydrogenase subunit 6 [Amritodus flavoscutatus]WQF70197.1 NADH dehydrogenase subunit 6 [Amritodus flavoscutatus]
MKMNLMKFMVFIISLAPLMNTPMSLGILLMIQTFMMITLINKMMVNSWICMITFLMMIGGLLIIFIYMSSLASNEKFKINLKLMFLLILMMMLIDEMLNDLQIMESQLLLNMSMEQLSLSKIYNKKSMVITIMMVIYLLLTMIVVTKMVKHYEGPLRSKN